MSDHLQPMQPSPCRPTLDEQAPAVWWSPVAPIQPPATPTIPAAPARGPGLRRRALMTAICCILSTAFGERTAAPLPQPQPAVSTEPSTCPEVCRGHGTPPPPAPAPVSHACPPGVAAAALPLPTPERQSQPAKLRASSFAREAKALLRTKIRPACARYVRPGATATIRIRHNIDRATGHVTTAVLKGSKGSRADICAVAVVKAHRGWKPERGRSFRMFSYRLQGQGP